METPEERGLGSRARRAVPVIAVAVATIVIAAVVYVRPTLPALMSAPAAPLHEPPLAQGTTGWTLDPAYQVAYDFESATVGWAAIARTHGAGVAYWIFGTSDGARHWTLQDSGSIVSEASVDLHFFDGTHGYAVIGRRLALATADGGVHWERLLIPALYRFQLTFADPDHGWFGGAGDAETGTGIRFPFYATSDAGSSWSRLPAPPGGGVAFRNASEGWTMVSTLAGATVYSTRDGGLTWNAHALLRTGSPSGTGVYEPAEVRLLPGHGVMAAAETFAFTSQDGRTWTPVVAPPGARFFDMAFEDATHWWAMPSGNLFKSSDAGRSWQRVSLQFDDWQYRVQVVDADHAWALLDAAAGIQDPTRGTALAVTSDGGLTWDYAPVPQPSA